jgi:ketosteroid isomerase-like protein
MSRENVELVKSLQPSEVDLVERLAEADGGEDFLAPGGPLELFADDLDVQFVAAASAQQPQYQGGEGVLEGWRDWLSPWASYRLETEDFLDAGDEVVVLVRVRARTVHDGVEIEHAPAAVWTFEGGKVVRIRFFLEREEALKAAGLPV